MTAQTIYENLTRNHGALLRIVDGQIRPYFLFRDSMPDADWEALAKHKASLIEIIKRDHPPLPDCITARPNVNEQFAPEGPDLAAIIIATCGARGHPLSVGTDGVLIINDALPDALYEAAIFNSDHIIQIIERNENAST